MQFGADLVEEGNGEGQGTQDTFFTLVFIGKICLQVLQVPVENVWIKEGLPSVEECQAMTILTNRMYKSPLVEGKCTQEC